MHVFYYSDEQKKIIYNTSIFSVEDVFFTYVNGKEYTEYKTTNKKSNFEDAVIVGEFTDKSEFNITLVTLPKALANILYHGDATVLHMCAADDITVDILRKWIDDTIDMINNGECDDFNIIDIELMKRYIDCVVFEINSW
jgi:hypothetical protein